MATQPERRRGEKALEDLIKLALKPLGFIGAAVLFLGLIYLGITLSDVMRGGGETLKAIALITAGGVILGFAAIYGFKGF